MQHVTPHPTPHFLQPVVIAPLPAPAVPLDPEGHWTDGHCTGFPDGIGPWNWQSCCLVHDMGGTDGQLIDCISDVLPDWAEVIVLLAVAAMCLFRPIYLELHKLGLAK